eukprot:4332088-Prorocentrum_lima.AAC.1
MTSSLVGSEMCIRDSEGTAGISATTDGWLPLSSLSSHLASQSGMASPVAVSYTHLTLPTICSV